MNVSYENDTKLMLFSLMIESVQIGHMVRLYLSVGFSILKPIQ